MQQSQQEPERSITIKKPATLDSLPEDVALVIVEMVNEWVLEGKGKTFRGELMAIQARNYTLRAIALSCRRNYHTYFPALLQTLLIGIGDLLSIQSLLQRENYGQLVRSLHLVSVPTDFTSVLLKSLSTGSSETAKSLIANDLAAVSGRPSSVDYSTRFQQGLLMVSTSIFHSVLEIETLIIESNVYIDGLFLKRHTCLTSSLKKLYIRSAEKERGNLSAKNTLWLLLFVPSLSEAAFSLDFSIIDFELLLEIGDTVEGLSRVSKLSLETRFIWNDSKSKTWWGFREELYRHTAQGNQKTFAVSQLLRCVNTSQLVSLEIVGDSASLRKGDDTLLSTECLTVLHRSFGSLLHLRLLWVVTTRRATSWSDSLSNFKSLKMLTMDDFILERLHSGGSKFMVPSSLEVVWLPFYDDKRSEAILLRFIEFMSSDLPKMREVGLRTGRTNEENRERLEQAEIFSSGRVSFRNVEWGATMGDASKPGEVFLSTYRWISS